MQSLFLYNIPWTACLKSQLSRKQKQSHFKVSVVSQKLLKKSLSSMNDSNGIFFHFKYLETRFITQQWLFTATNLPIVKST